MQGNKAKEELPVLPVTSIAAWEQWLEQHHATNSGVWLKIAKKGSESPEVAYSDILDVALTYGWIDGLRKGFDERFYLQKFTPRRLGSLWSKRNIEKIAILMTAGRMQPSGLAEVEAAKRDGRWVQAYDSQKNMKLPDDFLQELAHNKQALTTFKTLNRTNLYAIGFRLQTAKKPETRQRRLKALLAMLERGEKLY